MKKISKILLVIIIFSMFSITVSYGGMGIGNLTGNQEALKTTTLKDKGNDLYSIVTSIGVVVSVIAIAVLGIKYMLGSVEEKAEYKKTLMPYIIGAALLFGASTIAEIIYRFVK